MEHNVRDTTLYVPSRSGGLPFNNRCHTKTKERWRISAGKQPITNRKVTPEEMEKLWR